MWFDMIWCYIPCCMICCVLCYDIGSGAEADHLNTGHCCCCYYHCWWGVGSAARRCGRGISAQYACQPVVGRGGGRDGLKCVWRETFVEVLAPVASQLLSHALQPHDLLLLITQCPFDATTVTVSNEGEYREVFRFTKRQGQYQYHYSSDDNRSKI